MNFNTDCIPCLFNQLDEILKLCHADQNTSKRVISRIAGLIKDFKYDCVPPEKAGLVMNIIEEETGVIDPYIQEKIKSTELAKEYYPHLKKVLNQSFDKLLCAVDIAISGNIIDYGAKSNFDMDAELHKLFNGIDSGSKEIFQIDSFRKDLLKADKILYLLDNCGEIYFDKVLIEQLVLMGKKVIAVVRGGVIINDVTIKEAKECGLTEMVEVMDTGAALPGAVLKMCSEEFLEQFKSSDLIISKGQGNYEALEESKDSRIYFLFKVKCPVVAEHSGCELGSIVLRKG